MPVNKKQHKKQTHLKGEAISTVKKGKIVEKITAAFHENPDVTVRLNAFLRVVGGGRRRREIDVLVIGQLAGYTMRIAFECKNERPPIGVQKIDEFVGKLKDVGIPLQNGVYVSASGYTEGAIERAQKEGIRVFTLEGLTKEGLSAILYEAFQAVVFLIADLAQFTIEYTEETGCSEDPYKFFNDKGEFCGYLHHFIWDAWRKGLIPFSIGEHPLDLQIPPNLYHTINEELKLIESINIKLQITGFVIGFPGKAEHFSLLDAANKSLERTKLNVNFDTPEGRYPTTAIRTKKK